MFLKLVAGLLILSISACTTSMDEKNSFIQKEVVTKQESVNSLNNFKKYYKADLIIDEKHNLKACLREFVYGCSTDSECHSKATDNCSQYLPQECSYGTFGVECDQPPSHCSLDENLNTVQCPEFNGI